MTAALEDARLARTKPNWPIVRLKHVAQLVGGGTPSKDNEEFWTGGAISWVSPKDMKRRVIDDTEDHITEAAVMLSATSYVDEGWPLIVVRSGILRHTLPVAIAGRRLTLNQDMKAFRLSNRLNNRFLAYWIEGQSAELLLEWRQFGATVESIDTTRMMNGRIAIPDLRIQSAIADFLDRETVRIDQLVEKKLSLVDLLDEKRATALSQHITGPLSGSRELVETCSRFLPVAPSHWQLSKLKLGILDIEQGWSPECEARLAEDGEWGVLKVGCVNYGQFRDTEHKALPNELSPRPSLEVRSGDLLMSRANTAELVGSVALVDRTRSNLMLCDKLYRIVVNKKRLDAAFLYFVLNDRYVRRQIESECSGASQSMQNLSQAFVREIEIAYPPLHEQSQIAGECRRVSQSIAALIAKVQSSIILLHELRSALITAAVTGQIDVATWSRRGDTGRRLEAIEYDLEAEREEATV